MNSNAIFKRPEQIRCRWHGTVTKCFPKEKNGSFLLETTVQNGNAFYRIDIPEKEAYKAAKGALLTFSGIASVTRAYGPNTFFKVERARIEKSSCHAEHGWQLSLF